MMHNRKQFGFTLLELLLYVSMATITLLIFFTMYNLVTSSRQKSYAIKEINEQGLAVSQRVTQLLRNAASVSIAAGSENSEIVITDDSAENVTVSEDNTQILENSNALTNGRIEASDLEFRNVARPSAPASIQFEFTLSSDQYTQTFQASASLRE